MTPSRRPPRLPASPDAAHQPARDRPRHRRRRDRPVCRAGLPRGAAGADEDRQGPPHRHLDAGGHGAFQPRQLHPLLLGRRGHGPAVAPVVSQSYTFECADGKWIAIHMSSPAKFWEGMLAATGQEQLARDPRFAERLERIKHQDDLIEILTPGLPDEVARRVVRGASRQRGAPFARLRLRRGAGGPAGGASATQGLGAIDGAWHLHHRAAALQFRRGAGPHRLAPPVLDEHGPEIRAELQRRKAS
jgi:crotonobetainyl-CoA:carnitine CoA-transferase CaiB-like acyl-CoA transferase